MTAMLRTVCFALAGPLLAGIVHGQELRIISPANGTEITPDQELAVEITGEGEFLNISVAPSPVGGGDYSILPAGISAPSGRPPWVVPLDVPLKTDPQRYTIIAVGLTAAGTQVASAPVEIDVEPTEIPAVSFFNGPFITLSVKGCLALNNESGCPPFLVFGTYPDGTEVNLNWSTRIQFVSQSPAIARISEDGSSLIGVSPGKTKLTVFGKYAVDVTVFGKDR
jgi:hypothetical protein